MSRILLGRLMGAKCVLLSNNCCMTTYCNESRSYSTYTIVRYYAPILRLEVVLRRRTAACSLYTVSEIPREPDHRTIPPRLLYSRPFSDMKPTRLSRMEVVALSQVVSVGSDLGIRRRRRRTTIRSRCHCRTIGSVSFGARVDRLGRLRGVSYICLDRSVWNANRASVRKRAYAVPPSASHRVLQSPQAYKPAPGPHWSNKRTLQERRKEKRPCGWYYEDSPEQRNSVPRLRHGHGKLPVYVDRCFEVLLFFGFRVVDSFRSYS